jgi:hypothetical protein
MLRLNNTPFFKEEKMKNTKLYWAGTGISYLLGFFFAFNVLVKLFPETFYPQMVEQMAAIGLQASILSTVAILEGLCVVVYLIPATSVLGAILFTGYMGGAILTHLRVGQPVFIQVLFGILIWLGLYLREPRLRELLPIRKKIK